ncbi:hypothetical protein GZD99_001582 [Escherichia coli]|nr:hypothetical protein [Escherichia coli]
MCIEMCIGLILEHVEMALLLVAWLVVLFPSPPFLKSTNLLNPKGYGLTPSDSFTHCNQHCD